MNIPNSDKKDEIPEEAAGNPVYEQTRQDMPLWCCGRNCGRNTRFVVLGLALVGIGCSIWACLSPNYFTFVQIRNDTFYEKEKFQPEPFEYATEAHVGLFKYEILDVFEFPWPPTNERQLFDEMLLEELQRMRELKDQEDVGSQSTLEGEDRRNLQDATTPPTVLDDTNTTQAPTPLPEETALPTYRPTRMPTGYPTPMPSTSIPPTATVTEDCSGAILPGPGSVACGVTASPTMPPSGAPTPINPNIIVQETTEIGVVKKYEDDHNTLDSIFQKAQRGAIMGPVFAFVGTIFSLVELCCCTYKCSWLPTALFLYLAFMFQMFTLFLFLSEDWCKYDQECALGNAGFASVVAVLCYFIAQNLVCCSPRPTPYFNCCKKPPVRKKKKKKPEDNPDDEDEDLMPDYDDPDYDRQRDSFRDEPNSSYGDPYDDGTEDDYDYAQDSYMDASAPGGYSGDETIGESDVYNSAYDNDTYAQDTYGDDTYGDDGDSSYYTYDDGTAEQPPTSTKQSSRKRR